MDNFGELVLFEYLSKTKEVLYYQVVLNFRTCKI